MVAVHFIGVNIKDKAGKRDQLRIYVNVFFPQSFRGVMDLKYPDIVRVSGRLTGIEELDDPKGQNNTVIRLAIHGYSINKALRDTRTDVAAELGVA